MLPDAIPKPASSLVQLEVLKAMSVGFPIGFAQNGIWLSLTGKLSWPGALCVAEALTEALGPGSRCISDARLGQKPGAFMAS